MALSVRDVEESARWYIDVLGLERRHEGLWNGVPVFIGKGTTALALFPAQRGIAGKESDPASTRMSHLAFRASRAEFLNAQRDLKQRNIAFGFEDHEVSHSIYFRDPDGHGLEITTYEIA